MSRSWWSSEDWAWRNVCAARCKVTTAPEGWSTATAGRRMTSTSTARGLLLVCASKIVRVEDVLVAGSGGRASRGALEKYLVLVIGDVFGLSLVYVRVDGAGLGSLCGFGCDWRGALSSGRFDL